ncbi:PAS domain-containing sensor histidine kinase [Paenibacillus spongiae]|uniref:histidine kinase n=1 Tax=Paenibacillus spongiae TaxID=2909671 RepID=A0ABY5S8F5_9BACL|nr:PAS domain S-box protein [Paenibacillus spongiae]UVI30201.1 PAS domain S-box protein [Paenibacillus spongiae]
MKSSNAEEFEQSLQQELEETLREQQGMTFRFARIEDRFIHTYCEGRLLHKLGLSSAAVVGRELKEFYPIEMAIEKEVYYHRAWNGEEDVSYEGEINGTYYLASLRPVRRDGKVVEVIASSVDISERKRAEDELKSTKDLLESLIGNSADGICVTDVDGNVIRVNRAFEEIYGWSEEELVGTHLPIFTGDSNDELRMISDKLQSGENIVNLQTIRQRKDGECIHVCVTISPIKNAEGSVVALAGMTRDISERKRNEEFFRKADKLNVVGQLAAGLAHEIRNPLTSLRGFIQLMRTGGTGKPEYYDILISELDRINNIVNEFLIIAKPHAASFRTNDIIHILSNVVTLLEAQAAMNNIQIYLETEDDLPQLECSELEIKQVFINLLKNAIEAMPGGGEIRIVAAVQHNEFLIRIIDQGDGIPESQIPRLGEPFYTTKEKGTGLGLMMCYKIINDHQGRIAIESIVGKGTTFEIILPLNRKC